MTDIIKILCVSILLYVYIIKINMDKIGLFLEMKHILPLKNKLSLFFQKIYPDAFTTLIFIVIPEKVFTRLSELDMGTKRIEYVNSKEFLDSIVYTLCTVHNPKDKTIMLGDCSEEHILKFIDAVNLYFESSFSVISEYEEGLVDSGFTNPFVCFKNKICITRPNTFTTPIDKSVVHRDLAYIKSQLDDKACSVVVDIDKETADFLKFTTRASVVSDDSGRYQREVFGKLRVLSNKVENGDIVYTLKLDKESLIHGSAENIDGITPDLYTFHSHPYEAYKRHKTSLGFPSASDYIAMYNLYKYKAILHFVSAIEGLYVISVNTDSKMLSKPQEAIIKFIKENYKIEKRAVKDIHSYVKSVNSHGLFKLELIPWEECSSKKIRVSFGKDGDNCLLR